MKKKFFFIFLVTLLFSCSTNSEKKQPITDSLVQNKDSSTAAVDTESIVADEDSFDNEPYSMRYIVIADSSTDYALLEREGKQLASKLKTKYVKLHLYDKENGLVDDTVDYWYSWRRQGGEEINETDITVEIKYYYYMDVLKEAKYETMVLIAGMFDKEEQAKEFLKKVQVHQPKAFLKAINMFMGCRS